MGLELTITNNQPLHFMISASEGQPFVVSSLLIVNRDGRPIWEFVRDDFEACEMEVSEEVVTVLTDEFRALLQEVELPRPAPVGHEAKVQLEVTYGVVPRGYKQSIPDGNAPELKAGKYRAVVFASVGSASEAFEIAR
ncbi:MAG TPA: hypothetical protein VEK79_16900 [Thermoanaerobaculia bacterium]|nr:hypothetical protein [Thermoanaerobaculia bacterium]